MTARTLKFAIFGNTYQAKKSVAVENIIRCLNNYGAYISIDSEYYHFLVEEYKIKLDVNRVFRDNDFDADFVISMGGDGTFLKAVSRVGDKSIPIIGVNMGRLGFLADVCPNDFRYCLETLYSGDYTVESRTLMEVVADADFLGSKYALNDVAILKRDNASMISIPTSINGNYITTYEADGLIVSTPTGSTAYSLSNGGPIIVPGTKVFSLTAVAPHSLNVRPMVIADNSELTFQVECRSSHFLLAIDGRSETLPDGSSFSIRRAPFSVKIVKRPGKRYFDTLREKMMWGADPRI
ncbi:MAG: NAD kinase [Prevotella sp.]|nr:NAD kinase [Prevotella sp.]MCI7016749.1 NAD kinase [Prevotella sp.]MDD7028545.1 NAD kinase [Prevotellaceae bacterium]MDY4556307.1 NAD kinase [Prevotella sp.]MDY5210399.1 NAD kinase [Prevotella sp.]